MGSLIFNVTTTFLNPKSNKNCIFTISKIVTSPLVNLQSICAQRDRVSRFSAIRKVCYSTNPQRNGDYNQQSFLQELRVPSNWLEPSKASQEAEWLRVTLQKWLDEEYCPELTNIEISKIAASSFYKSLIEKQTDLGEILLKMAVELESISYQESFHGAFSSANAAVNLIIQRIAEE